MKGATRFWQGEELLLQNKLINITGLNFGLAKIRRVQSVEEGGTAIFFRFLPGVRWYLEPLAGAIAANRSSALHRLRSGAVDSPVDPPGPVGARLTPRFLIDRLARLHCPWSPADVQPIPAGSSPV